MKPNIFTLALGLGLFLIAESTPAATDTQRLYLSGRGKDDAVRWDFFCTEGRSSGCWTNIKVPSNWELQGFGSYNYGHDPMSKKSKEIGKYRHGFAVPAAWQGQRVFVVFEGAMTDTEVLVNGQSAGPIHQGGFYRFKYELTGLVKFGGTNLLEVNVSKISANSSVEAAEREADYWLFGGICRPVYLEAVPPSFVEWTAVDARADGSFRLDVHCLGITAPAKATVRILTRDGQPVGKPVSAPVFAGDTSSVTLRTQVENPALWSAETPNLYQAEVTLEREGKPLHSVRTRFGFRTFEMRAKQGLFLNGQRVLLQGADRHSFWPDSGRCLSREVCYNDVKLMKSMNMNAARMSHYPPDVDFLEACDELGLYVLDELAGWQIPPYDTTVGKRLVRQMVMRDVNHPSILFWDNGNEGGWNRELDAEFWLYDPQRRTVLHPWESNQGMNTAHYRTYAEHVALLAGKAGTNNWNKKIHYVTGDLYMPTEFLHGLYDGGHGAGLRDYWREMRASAYGAGGFLWALVDEGVVRTDQRGFIDCAVNLAPDGIVGPSREKKGSFNTIKELWSPVQVLTKALPENFNGTLEIENQYSFTSLSQCRFAWELADFRKPGEAQAGHVSQATGELAGPAIAPGQRGALKLSLPGNWRKSEVLYLTAFGPAGEELWTWSWRLKSAQQITGALPSKPGGSKVNARVAGSVMEVKAGELLARFDLNTGRLLGVQQGVAIYPLANGPRLAPAGSNEAPAKMQHAAVGADYQVTAEQGALRWTWIVKPSGELVLECNYALAGAYDFLGVTFDFPEEALCEKTWLGNGPYRVWKNRLPGVRADVWRTAFNDPIPGKQWEYPEFKGYFSDFVWADFTTGGGHFTVLTETPDIFMRVGTPNFGEKPMKAIAAFPEGNLSFLHGIAPIGNKFTAAKDVGPESQKNEAAGQYSLKLKFQFGK